MLLARLDQTRWRRELGLCFATRKGGTWPGRPVQVAIIHAVSRKPRQWGLECDVDGEDDRDDGFFVFFLEDGNAQTIRDSDWTSPSLPRGTAMASAAHVLVVHTISMSMFEEEVGKSRASALLSECPSQ